MYTIKEPDVFRTNIKNKFSEIIKNEKIASNLEKGIYNYSIQTATKTNIVKKWDNIYFIHIYLNKLHSIYMNIKCPKLIKKITSKEIKAHKIAFMTHQELKPEKWEKLIEAKRIKDNNKYTPQIEASTDNFTCWKCKSKKCSYYQLQTRSADEPMTTFVNCIDCGNRWKC